MREQRQLARYRTEIRDSYELGYLFGTFLGDGHAFLNTNGNSEIGRVAWYFGPDEHETAREARRLRRGGRPACAPRSSARAASIDVHLYSLQWARLLAQFGKRDEKHLPQRYLLRESRCTCKGLLDGLVDSDGHIDADGRLCFQEHVARSWSSSSACSASCSTGASRTSTVGAAVGRRARRARATTAAATSFTVAAERRRTRSGTSTEFQVVKPLGSRDLGLAVPVYDIEVDCPTHSFIADNAIVHNSICTTRVVAGVGVPQITAIYDCAAGRRASTACR